MEIKKISIVKKFSTIAYNKYDISNTNFNLEFYNMPTSYDNFNLESLFLLLYFCNNHNLDKIYYLKILWHQCLLELIY